MITDKSSRAYKIATEIADIWQRDGKDEAARIWDEKYADDQNLSFWVQHAIGETIFAIVKEAGIAQ